MSFTTDYNKARLAKPGLTVEQFRANPTATLLPQVAPQAASLPQNNPIQNPIDYQSKLDGSLTKMGISGSRATQLLGNDVFRKNLFEMSLTPEERQNIPEYQSLVAKDKQRENFGGELDQMKKNSTGALRALENALREKNDIGNQPLGESEYFKAAGLDDIYNLQRSLGANLNTMKDRYGSFTNVLSRVSQDMADQYIGLSSSYKTLSDEYQTQYASLNSTLDKIAQHEEAMGLAEKEAELQRDTAAFTAKLEKNTNKYSVVKDDYGEIWKLNQVTGDYTKMDGSNLSNVESLNIGQSNVTATPETLSALQRADAAMFAATGEHIKVNSSNRTYEEQKAIRDKFGYTSDDQPSGYNGLPPAAPPGQSLHESGQAVDVTNWEAAKPFLNAEGIAGGGMIPNDPGHFSLAGTEFGNERVAFEPKSETSPQFAAGNAPANKLENPTEEALAQGAAESDKWTDVTQYVKGIIGKRNQADANARISARVSQIKSSTGPLKKQLTISLIRSGNVEKKDFETIKNKAINEGWADELDQVLNDPKIQPINATIAAKYGTDVGITQYQLDAELNQREKDDLGNKDFQSYYHNTSKTSTDQMTEHDKMVQFIQLGNDLDYAWEAYKQMTAKGMNLNYLGSKGRRGLDKITELLGGETNEATRLYREVEQRVGNALVKKVKEISGVAVSDAEYQRLLKYNANVGQSDTQFQDQFWKMRNEYEQLLKAKAKRFGFSSTKRMEDVIMGNVDIRSFQSELPPLEDNPF